MIGLSSSESDENLGGLQLSRGGKSASNDKVERVAKDGGAMTVVVGDSNGDGGVRDIRVDLSWQWQLCISIPVGAGSPVDAGNTLVSLSSCESFGMQFRCAQVLAVVPTKFSCKP